MCPEIELAAASFLKRTGVAVDPDSVEREFASIVDQLVDAVSAAGDRIRAQRESAPPLDAPTAKLLTDAYAAELRAHGWLTEVSPEQLDGMLEIVVMTESDGSASLDIDSNVTGSVWGVPGWGVTETDPAQVGRGLAEDELEILEDMREAGEITGWE
jgi:hypothetical protein